MAQGEEPTPPAPLPEGKGEKDLRNAVASAQWEPAVRPVTPLPDRRGSQGEPAGGSPSKGGRGAGGVGLL